MVNIVMNRIITVLLSIALAFAALAQQFTATGVVSSEADGEFLPISTANSPSRQRPAMCSNFPI